MIVLRCFKLFNKRFSQKYIWYAQPVLYSYGFKFSFYVPHIDVLDKSYGKWHVVLDLSRNQTAFETSKTTPATLQRYILEDTNQLRQIYVITNANVWGTHSGIDDSRSMTFTWRHIKEGWRFCIMTKSMHCLLLVYGIDSPLHVSGVSTAHHQEV
jgi:hypothetical protein